MKEYKKEGKPTLYLQTELSEQIANSIYAETDKYSITPTTFKSRKIQARLDDTQVTKQSQFVLEKVQFQLNTLEDFISTQTTSLNNVVNHCGMSTQQINTTLNTPNPVIESLEKQRIELKNQLGKLITYNTYIPQNDEYVYEDIYSNSKDNSVTRYGLNSSKLIKLAGRYNDEWRKLKLTNSEGSQPTSKKSNKANTNETSDKALYPIEVLALQKAIQSLQETDTKTVLIDIFEKNENGLINCNVNTKYPETHTVVLYKNNLKEFIVIDPTDSSYSTHIASDINTLLIGDNITLRASNKNIKIYTPKKDNTGHEPTNYRDCIDIAVKLAFGLNKHPHAINPSKIGELTVIQEITNSKEVNNVFDKEYGTARIRQASDDQVRSAVDTIMNKLNQQFKSISEYKHSDECVDSILQKNISSFNLPCSSSGYKTGVQRLFDTLISNQEDINIFVQSEIELLGTQIGTID